MKRTKLEEYVISNGLHCEINLDIDGANCSLFKDDDLYVRFYQAKTLNEAIEKAINAHREGFTDDKRSKQDIQNEKRTRMLHQKFSKR
jgi:hypothetical protein